MRDRRLARRLARRIARRMAQNVKAGEGRGLSNALDSVLTNLGHVVDQFYGISGEMEDGGFDKESAELERYLDELDRVSKKIKRLSGNVGRK